MNAPLGAFTLFAAQGGGSMIVEAAFELARLPYRVEWGDLYAWTITLWRPGRAWFAEHAPRLHAIALAAESLPAVAAVYARNRR